MNCARAFSSAALTYGILCSFLCLTACEARFFNFGSIVRGQGGHDDDGTLGSSDIQHFNNLEYNYGNRKIDRTQQRRLATLHELGYTSIGEVPVPDDYPKGTSNYATRRWYLFIFWTRSSAITKNFYYYYDETKCTEQTPCPAYFYVDGTSNAGDIENRDHIYLPEMAKRGFVAVSVDYDDDAASYVLGDLVEKTRYIFDENRAGSVIDQLCNPSSTHPAAKLIDCSAGIATNGWSQGAHIAARAGNYCTKITASLLFGNGLNGGSNDQLTLDKSRRRSIVGEVDNFFGGDFDGVQAQQIATTGYDCSNSNPNTPSQRFDCFNRLPESCSVYSDGEQYCPENGRMYKLSCSECNEDVICPNTFVRAGACPLNEKAGYYIIPGGPHNFMDNDGWFQSFIDPSSPHGLEQNFDWLSARTLGSTIETPTDATSPPSEEASDDPSNSPSVESSASPSSKPSLWPSSGPSSEPSQPPTNEPTSSPSSMPSLEPSLGPSGSTSMVPSSSPTGMPTSFPSLGPSVEPSLEPTGHPSVSPSLLASAEPSLSWKPSATPSESPTGDNTESPSSIPSVSPSMLPTMEPSKAPTGVPTSIPSSMPSPEPSVSPSILPSMEPSKPPTGSPTSSPSSMPSLEPSAAPSRVASAVPTATSSKAPSTSPSPTQVPSSALSAAPSSSPTHVPSVSSSEAPSQAPSVSSSEVPSQAPTFATTTGSLFEYDFEDESMQDWTGGGLRSDSASGIDYARGSYSVRIRANSGTASILTSPSFPVTGYSTLNVSFWFIGRGMNNGESFELAYSKDGSQQWTVLEEWVRNGNVNFVNKNWYNPSGLAIPVDGSSSIVIRFECKGSFRNDRVYIDDITVEGQL